MKSLTAVALLALSTTAFAGEITLSAGMSAHIRPDEVTRVVCGDASSTLPACSIRRDTRQGTYVVYVAEELFDSYYSLESAIARRNQLQEARVCQ